MFEHHNLQILQICTYLRNYHSREVVGRGSEAQLEDTFYKFFLQMFYVFSRELYNVIKRFVPKYAWHSK